jgi:hypothetical protein
MAVACGSDPAPSNSDDASTEASVTDTPTVGDAAEASMGSADVSTADGAALPGESLVLMYRCANCHQSTNAADGILSGQSTPRPNTMAYGSNLTPHPTAGLGMWTEDQVVRAIREGIDESGRMLCRTMPRYGSAPANMTVEQARQIAQYLRSLPPIDRRIPMSVCP